MRYIWITILTLTMSALAADTQFLPLPQDFPIMDGMRVEKSQETIFNNAEGRIMIFVAHTEDSIQKVQKFYTDTLKNLGWIAKGANTFVRELEQLDMSFESIGTETDVTFAFKPCS